MAFDYLQKIDGIIDVLKAHNTITASPYLSSSLTTCIPKTMILNDDPQVRGIRNDEYPAIFVRLASSDEEWGGVGPTGATGASKIKDLTFDLLGFYRREGILQGNTELMNEIYQMTENIESVLRAEYTASNTALWIQPTTVDFFGPFNDGTTWIKVVQMKIDGKYHFR